MFSYTRAYLKDRVNSGIFGKKGMLVDFDATINQAARETLNDFDLASTKRRAALAPLLFYGLYDYSAPSDLKAKKVTDIPGQTHRHDDMLRFVGPEEFDRHKEFKKGHFTIDDRNGVKVLRIASDVDNLGIEFNEIQETGWTAFGVAESVARETSNFIKGSAATSFALSSSSGTTAGIQNTAITSVDITAYQAGDGSMFVYVYLPNIVNITSFSLRYGSSSSDYATVTVTAQHNGEAFEVGWNLLRFDLYGATETGTPVFTALDYLAFYMNKDVAKVSETGFIVDWMALKRGKYHYISYYSSFPWISADLTTRKLNSTLDTDLLVATEDEIDLFIEKGIIVASPDVREYENEDSHQRKYAEKLFQYKQDHPSDAKIQMSTYMDFDNTLYG